MRHPYVAFGAVPASLEVVQKLPAVLQGLCWAVVWWYSTRVDRAIIVPWRGAKEKVSVIARRQVLVIMCWQIRLALT